jgi:hypothetical protein
VDGWKESDEETCQTGDVKKSDRKQSMYKHVQRGMRRGPQALKRVWVVKERSRRERGRERKAGEDKLQEAWPNEGSQTQVQAHAAGSASWRAEHEPPLAICADWSTVNSRNNNRIEDKVRGA